MNGQMTQEEISQEFKSVVEKYFSSGDFTAQDMLQASVEFFNVSSKISERIQGEKNENSGKSNSDL